jgi:energy-coupling factor transport system ATP-binding protein
MSLTLSGIGFAYPGAGTTQPAALSAVSLEVEPGELLLVLGATGSGKSTLLRICAGLLTPTAGSIEVDGAALTAAHARGNVGIVFQDPESQLFAETVVADVAFGPTNLGAGRDASHAMALDALGRVGLPAEQFAERSPFGLSGGEARRAAIAGVIAMEPRYLLLDEPTAGLDARGRTAVRELIRAERARSGVIVVSHSAAEFLGEADRVLLLAQGRSAFEGLATELIAHPEAFAAAGLSAPDVLRVQMLARERGVDVGALTLDPAAAACALADAGGWR